MAHHVGFKGRLCCRTHKSLYWCDPKLLLHAYYVIVYLFTTRTQHQPQRLRATTEPHDSGVSLNNMPRKYVTREYQQHLNNLREKILELSFFHGQLVQGSYSVARLLERAQAFKGLEIKVAEIGTILPELNPSKCYVPD
jgi:hypothetical protein